MVSKVILPHAILCSSALHDSDGIVFQYQGRIFRALYPRGVDTVQFLHSNFDVQKLAQLGLVVPGSTEFEFSGYPLVEAEMLSPIISPNMWTTEMLGRAALTVIRICRELLKKDLVLWDLKGLHNMTFHPVKGPQFFDLGAIHSLRELDEGDLDTSYESLFDQIMDAFYLPLWLATGRFRNHRLMRRLLSAKRSDPESGIARGLINRLTLAGRLAPGYFKCRRLIKERRLDSLYAFLDDQVVKFLAVHAKTQALTVKAEFNWNLDEDATQAILATIDPGNRILDLDPCGSNFGESPSFDRYTGYVVVDRVEYPDDPFLPNRENQRKWHPVPLQIDPWDRSLRFLEPLTGAVDLVMVMSDIFGYCTSRRIPLDFFGRIAARLSNRYLLLVVWCDAVSGKWPNFITPPSGTTPNNFVMSVIGKYFDSVTSIPCKGPTGPATMLLFEKSLPSSDRHNSGTGA